MSETIFTKIIQGQLPCHKVYEDQNNFAFMDIHPIQPGHVVVAAKTPVESFLDLNQQEAAALWNAVREVSKRLKAVFPDKRIAVVFEGLEVPHVHAKVYPFSDHAQFMAQPKPDEPNHQELERIAGLLQEAN